MINKKFLLRNNFSKAAKSYDESAQFQKEIARELFDRIILPEKDSIVLDIGTGTGFMAEQFQDIGFINKFYALDINFEMLSVIKEKKIEANLIQSDAKYLSFKDETFDLIVSNVSYQWVGDLNSAFREVKRVLKKEGKFYFTIFTDNTLKELRDLIVKYPNGKKIDNAPLVNLRKCDSVWKILEKEGFIITKVDLKETRQYYSNLLELIYWLKNIGTNRCWPKALYKGLSAGSFIENISKYYQEQFREKGKIFATFEVLFVQAMR